MQNELKYTKLKVISGTSKYGKNYSGNKEWIIFNKTTIYNIKHLLTLFAGILERDINDQHQPSERSVYSSLNEKLLRQNMDKITWNDVLNYKQLLQSRQHWSRYEYDTPHKIIGIIYMFLELILSFNGRDKKVIYSACWERKVWNYEGESGYQDKDYGSLFIYQTDTKLKAIDMICFDRIIKNKDDDEED